MDITRRCDYACRIIRAAYRSSGTFRSVADIAAEEEIPYAFARSIQHDLMQAGLITTVRGARGGLKLNCDPTSTTVRDVLVAVQGKVSVSSCAADPDFCDKSAACEFNKVWKGADVLLNDYFGSITLADLFEQGSSHPSVSAAVSCPHGSSSRAHAHAGCAAEIDAGIAAAVAAVRA